MIFAALLLASAVAYRAEYVGKAPVVDGAVAGDCAWAKAAWSSEFVLHRKGTPPKNASRFKAVYTDDALYLAIENFERNMAALGTDENKVEFWHCDVDELLFAVRKNELIHLIYSARDNANEQMDGAVKVRTGGLTGWSAKAKLFADRWTVEFCVPLFLLDVVPGASDVAFPFNACRNELAEKELSSWSFQKGSFMDIDGFGTLVLAPPPAAVREKVAAAARRPHVVTLARLWADIRKNPLWRPTVARHAKEAERLDALAGRVDIADFGRVFAEKLQVVRDDHAAAERARRADIEKRLFGE